MTKMPKLLKPLLLSLLCLAATHAQDAGVSASVGEDGTGTVSLTAKGILPKPKLFFTVDAVTKATLGTTGIDQTTELTLNILQGAPDVLTLELRGSGDVTSVTGKSLVDWAVRTSADGKKRYLDIKPAQQPGPPKPRVLSMTVQSRQKITTLPAACKLLTLAPGKAAGFSLRLEIDPRGLDARVSNISGMQPLEKPWAFHAKGTNSLSLDIHPSGSAPAAVELRDVHLHGSIDEKQGSATFTLTATANVTSNNGGSIDLLSGRAAVSSIRRNPAFRLNLVPQPESASTYRMEFDRSGTFPVELEIIARIDEDGTGWKTIDFTAPQGAVVPVRLTGLSGSVEFNRAQPLYPRAVSSGDAAAFAGFLPATGRCFLAWKKGRTAGEGKLAYTSRGLTDINVGAGLIRQTSEIRLKVLQGRITGLTLRMDGPGEILDISGTHVAGWTVAAGAGGSRNLNVSLSLPLENMGTLKIRSQQALGKFPVTATPLRLTPAGVLRHSGYVRLANSGAVRIESADVTGMMQLSPEQFPGRKISTRQVFVYRYPSADYSWSVRADQILPEVSLDEVLVYEQTESDRIIRANLELDIREAPLREWELHIPDGYAVASLSGAEVADYVVGTSVDQGTRNLKVLFKKAVAGRQLVTLRLEKNAPAKPGTWRLPILSYPEAKSVRGHIGVSAAAGWRVTPAKVNGLTETPLSYFPNKNPGIQQTYRLRAGSVNTRWSASMHIAAREQSVQADVFHLYSLKEGMAYGSVLLNYFVVGAPVTQWQLAIPEGFGNVAIEGQNVRQWRRVDAEKVIVELEQPVSGAATLLVTFENAMSARGGKLRLAEIHPLNVQGESGFIEVVSPVLVDHNTTLSTPGLLKISAQELPAEFRMLTTAPAIAAWQYAARPFELEIDVAWFDPGKTLDQVVDFAELKSHVSRDGNVMTEATFYVRTRGRQALKMTLPYGAKLWDASADGETITTRMDGDLYLLPLPAGDDPNKPVRVVVRYGGASESSTKVQLGAPVMSAPMIIAGWKVSAENGRLLVPVGKADGVRTPPLTQSGFESLQGRGAALLLVAVLFVLATRLIRRKDPALWIRLVNVVLLAALVVMSLALAREIGQERRVNQQFVEITAQVVSSESPVAITLKNIAPWRAMVSWFGVLAGVIGGIGLLAGLFVRKWRSLPFRMLAIALLAAGILAQRGGGMVFFYILAALAAILLVVALLSFFRHWSRWQTERTARRKKERAEAEEAVALGTAESDSGLAGDGIGRLFVIGTTAGALLFSSTHHAQAAPDAVPVIDSINQSWQIKNDRLYATMDIRLHGTQGASYTLLRESAVLTSLTGEGLRVTKVKQAGGTAWILAAERDGLLSATATYEMAMPQDNDGFSLPTGQAAVQKITATLDEPGLELFSKAAVQTVRAKESNKVDLVLAPLPAAFIGIRAKGRDIDAEPTKFYAEIANLYLPSPGVIDGVHRITVRPASGKISNMELTVPDGFTVGEVTGAAVGNWRFDPAGRKLSVNLQPAQSRAFSITVDTQRGLSALPADARLVSMTVAGDAGETNMLGLAFGREAQPGKITVQDLSEVNVDDFDQSLIPAIPNTKGQKRGILHKVYRSVSGKGSLNLRVAPVKPELRVVSRQELTLGSERTLLSAHIQASITRAGIFKLSFPLPKGMEVESLSGGALSHWSEAESGGVRTVTMHLNGKTLGAQQFAIVLTGPPAQGTGEWAVPRLSLNEAVRQSGELLVMPEKGIRIRAVSRKNVSRMNTQANFRSQSGARQPDLRVKQSGGLAFRLLQADWSLTLGIEKLDPWITASLLHEVTLREGQTRTRLSAVYQIDHAAVKSTSVRLPGLSGEEARTVRASGTAVKEIVHVKDDLWQLRFRRGILGSTAVQIEYQRGADRGKGGTETITPAIFPKAKRLAYFMAVRTTGRLDMQPGRPGNGWRAADWTAVPKALRNPADNSVPNLCYRLNEPEGTLSVALKRHEMADTLKLRVTGGKMMTIFSPHGDTLTSVNLNARVLEKTTMRIVLPADASLYNVMVNDEAVHVVRERDGHLFHVSPGPVKSEPAVVSLVYSTASSDGDIVLAAPGFNIPIESLEWDVLVPEGYRLTDASGEFELRGSEGTRTYTLADYLATIDQSRSEEAQKGQESLQKGNNCLRQGKRAQAAKEFMKVARNWAVDQASAEDARVQLRKLQTQEILWGLNSRRQRLYLDNKAAGNSISYNRDLEDSAVNNPLFQGKNDFDVRNVDDFLRGNSREEKKTLKQIANRLIGQQVITEPAITTIVRGRGEVLRFTRGIQVNGGKELTLALDIKPTSGTNPIQATLALLAIGLTGALAMKK